MLQRAVVVCWLVLFSGASMLQAAETLGAPAARSEFSGIYPHLAYFNEQGECGTGAVVPWADRLWVITYGPHLPAGSSDKLYEIDPSLSVSIRPESIGGTPANRMIHRESKQLFIGPYAIDDQRNVRAIPYTTMYGRHTATMRHLTDPANKVYYATMEEGFYEVDVRTLAVRELYPDANRDPKGLAGSLLPGYHGKGAYSGQGRVVYANNGEASAEARRRPDIPSGCLAEWDGQAWTVVRRNQFTEVTGPGGIYGNPHPETDPIWSIGWDHRSLLLQVLDAGVWHLYRLPKAAHTYDGAHGWNTEWPRIREIGEDDLLMTMHGTFWRFPPAFSASRAAGIRPRSTYLKVIGDFCRWHDRLVFGCDDAAKSEFLNKRRAKGALLGPGQSQSNLWFADPELPDKLGPALGRGAVWVRDQVPAGTWSDPYLFAGYERRGAHLSHAGDESVTFEFEVDAEGQGRWTRLPNVTVPPAGYAWVEFPREQAGEWIRVRPDRDCDQTTVWFQYSQADPRPETADAIFDGLAAADDGSSVAGLLRCRGENLRTLSLAAMTASGAKTADIGLYELDSDAKLTRVEDAQAHSWLKQNAAIPDGILTVDAASVIYTDDANGRWRLPKGDSALDALTGTGVLRIAREVVTERDLFQSHGTFFELPAENAGGFAKVRPIATHNRRLMDYCSYRGLLVLTGISGGENNRRIIRSDDGQAAVWLGAVDDLWKLGKPRGQGGPWKETAVEAGQPSDPYLMTGYDRKSIRLSHDADSAVSFTVQVNITGDGLWCTYQTFTVAPGQTLAHDFSDSYNAYWLRTVVNRPCRATAQLEYR
jgi:hypothetical protein